MTSIHKIPFTKHDVVRVGFIGVGGRGSSLLGELLALEGVQIAALADAGESAVAQAAARVRESNQSAPLTFSGPEAWRRLVDEPLDIIYIATPWNTHVPYAVAAMEAGKHAAVEVPAATTLEECWQLVEASERTRQHCIMLENCCYDYWETLVKRMVHAGLLGDINHAECAYIHDLRSLLFSDKSEGLWRRQPHIERNGNLYPTHGLGPVAQCLGIGEEDAFDYMVSMSSREAGLTGYRAANVPADNPKWQESYQHGDMNISLIRTKLGRTIVLQHDVVSPRPYDRGFMISGSKGAFRDYPPRLFLDGVSQHEQWMALDGYRAEWEDPLWAKLGDIARGHGHGGMDYIMSYRLMQTLREGLPPDSDVYDAADWSAPGPLSELSVGQRSGAVDFPNFRQR